MGDAIFTHFAVKLRNDSCKLFIEINSNISGPCQYGCLFKNLSIVFTLSSCMHMIWIVQLLKIWYLTLDFVFFSPKNNQLKIKWLFRMIYLVFAVMNMWRHLLVFFRTCVTWIIYYRYTLQILWNQNWFNWLWTLVQST